MPQVGLEQADRGVYFVMLIALCEPFINGSNGGLGSEQGGIQVLMTLVSLHSWASLYRARRYVVGGLQSTSYNHKNQTLIFKNLKELQK